MPYLNNKIAKDKHNSNCWRGEVRRLYVRHGLAGKQVFVPWGLTCLECGVTVVNDEFRAKEKTPEQIKQREEAERLIVMLRARMPRRSFAEKLYYEQEARENEKQGLIENAILKMGKLYEENKEVPKNKIFEKLKEKLGTTVSEDDIEKFCLPEWKTAAE